MIFQEGDIDFTMIDWKQFEELCIDLLVKYHFHSITWRQGGADQGRDIEGLYATSNAIVGTFQERWMIECKHYSKGIGVSLIADKIHKLTVQKLDHFLLITSSYTTQDCRDWLRERQRDLPFKIHVIDGKTLKRHLAVFPEIVSRYFADDYLKLVKSLLRQWVFHDILPEAKALLQIQKNLNLEHLDLEELGFLWYVFYEGQERLNELCEEEGIKPISYEFLLPAVKSAANVEFSAFTQAERDFFGIRTSYGPLGRGDFRDPESGYSVSWVCLDLPDGDRLQVLLSIQKKLLNVRIAVRPAENKYS